MAKSIFITNGEQPFNQTIVSILLSEGHQVAMHLSDQELAEPFIAACSNDERQRLHLLPGELADEADFAGCLQEAITAMNGLDVLIHGNEMLDEHAWFEQRREELSSLVSRYFQRIFLWNKLAIAYMMKQKQGKIWFPIIYDTLYFDGYPASPMLNHGKISMMKCLTRECRAFRIDVNVLTLGYYDDGFDKQRRKQVQSGVEIFGLKPQLKPVAEMLSMLALLLEAPANLLGGQNIEVGIGIETNL